MFEMNDVDIVRWWSKVIPTDGCWHWSGSLTGSGYAQISVGGVLRSAHRLSYVMHKGPIPDGMEIDHACNNRSCVNPEHLRPMSHRDNVLRGECFSALFARRTHCGRCGLALSGDNIRLVTEAEYTYRQCVHCRREADRNKARRYRAARRAKVWSLDRSQEG